MKSTLAAYVLVCLAFGASAQGPSVQNTWISGTALHTNGTEGNNLTLGFPEELPNAACGYGPLSAAEFPGFKLVGISAESILKDSPMHGCGACLEVKCADQTYCAFSNTTETVLVYDTCRDCASNQLNLNSMVFEQLAPLNLGNISIMYRQVPCPFSGTITVHVNNYRTAAGGWLQLALRNVAGMADINSVQLAGAGSGNWIPMNNTFGANWELSKLPSPPLDLRISTQSGQTVELSGVITEGVTGNVATTAQFPA